MALWSSSRQTTELKPKQSVLTPAMRGTLFPKIGRCGRLASSRNSVRKLSDFEARRPRRYETT